MGPRPPSPPQATLLIRVDRVKFIKPVLDEYSCLCSPKNHCLISLKRKGSFECYVLKWHQQLPRKVFCFMSTQPYWASCSQLVKYFHVHASCKSSTTFYIFLVSSVLAIYKLASRSNNHHSSFYVLSPVPQPKRARPLTSPMCPLLARTVQKQKN